MVEEPEVVVHEADQPDFFSDLFDADVLTGEHRTEVDLAEYRGALHDGEDGPPVIEVQKKLSEHRGNGSARPDRVARAKARIRTRKPLVAPRFVTIHIMSKPIYWAIGAGALLAVVWFVARKQEPAVEGSVPESTAVAPSPSALASSDTRKPGTGTGTDERPRSMPSPSATPAASAESASTVLPVAGNAMPIDVSPGFEYLNKPAAEMKDTDGMWGSWRWHQKLQSEPRDEAWAPRVEAALHKGVLDALTAKGLDTQRIELPVIECRNSGCEIQAVGYLQDSMQGGFDFQDVLGGILAGPLGNDFDLSNHRSTMSTRPDNRVVFLTHLPRKET